MGGVKLTLDLAIGATSKVESDDKGKIEGRPSTTPGLRTTPWATWGSNSGGRLVVENSQFNNNEDGFDTNSQNGDNPPPQNGACPAGVKPPVLTNPESGRVYKPSTCWVFFHNYVHNPGGRGGLAERGRGGRHRLPVAGHPDRCCRLSVTELAPQNAIRGRHAVNQIMD